MLFLQKLFHIKGALYLEDLVPYLTVVFSLLVLYGLADVFFWKKYLLVSEDCHC